MLTGNLSSSTAGWAAIATGAAGLLGLLFIILMFTAGSPFGTLNDICNGLAAILSLILAAMLFARLRGELPLLSGTILALAILGASLAAVGSYLAISGASGWYRAGLFTALGYALIGVCLLVFSSLALRDHSLARGLAIFGMVTGGILALGLAAIPGILRGLDPSTYDFTLFNALWWTSSLGYLTLLPAWCILLGRRLLLGMQGGS